MKEGLPTYAEHNISMADPASARAGVLSGASPEMRRSIVSGMRWTFWLSALSVPFSFGTSIILARIAPEVIGTFGLLQIYIGVVSVFFFVGGNAVLIKFIPELDTNGRISFFASYFALNCIALVPWLVAATLWPGGLRYLFGEGHTGPFWIFLLYLSPIYILYSASLAALKGMLELKWAQGLDRIVTIGSFMIYVILFVAARSLLAKHYTAVIWGAYLSLVLVVAYSAIRRFLRLNPGFVRSRLHFLLPGGFWRYTLSLQGGSILNFFSGRLDYLLLLYFGGLALLGKYVALMSLLLPVSRVVTFFLDSLLPSLTNTLAHRDLKSSEELTEICIRIVVPASLIMAGLLVFFAHPIVLLLGRQYLGLEQLLWIAAPFAVVQGVGWITGSILSAIGRPDCDAISRALRIALFLILFFPLWHAYQLMGVVITWGACEVFYHAINLCFVIAKTPFRYHYLKTYWPSIVVLLGLPVLASRMTAASSLPILFGVFLVLVFVYLILARYSVREIRMLSHFILPDARSFQALRSRKA
ncbi:MAG: lipopolysaccharide biosynthesis protein [Candidatus Acidiferrales bacterium]